MVALWLVACPANLAYTLLFGQAVDMHLCLQGLLLGSASELGGQLPVSCVGRRKKEGQVHS